MRADIINELQQLQSSLASQVPVNVFTVPTGYFEALPAVIVRTIQGDRILQTIQPPANADVPEGYFDNLAGNILNKIKTQSEADTPLSPLLESLRNINVFTVPQGYFDDLGQSVMAEVHTDERETLSPTLEGLRQQQVLTVPADYFDTLADSITAKVQVPKGRVIDFRKVMRLAVAAVVMGAMALGLYKFTDKSDSGVIASGTQLALNSVQKEGIELSKDEAKYNAVFEQVSSDDIVDFLTANGDDVETALAAAAVNESELPTEDDLMLDEKALDNFLNGVDKSSTN